MAESNVRQAVPPVLPAAALRQPLSHCCPGKGCASRPVGGARPGYASADVWVIPGRLVRQPLFMCCPNDVCGSRTLGDLRLGSAAAIGVVFSDELVRQPNKGLYPVPACVSREKGGIRKQRADSPRRSGARRAGASAVSGVVSGELVRQPFHACWPRVKCDSR